MRKSFFLSLIILSALILPQSGRAQEAKNNDQPPAAAVVKLSMEKAIELALAHNEQMRIADQAIDEAEGSYTYYAADAFPQISGNASYTRYLERPYTMVDMSFLNPILAQFNAPPLSPTKSYFYNSHEWDFRLVAEQNLFTFGKVTNAIRLGGVYTDLAKQQKQITQQDLVAQTKESYLGVLFAREAVKVAESNLQLTQETYDVTAAKAQQGVLSKFDLLLVESELAAAKPELLRAQSQYQTALQALLFTIGEPLDREVEITGELSYRTLDAAKGALLNEAKIQRAELRALQLQEEMYDYSYKISRAMYFPTLKANGTYAYSGGTDKQIYPENPDDQMLPTLSFGVSLHVPLFDGLRSYGQMKQMAAKRGTAKLQYQQTARAIDLEISRLFDETKVQEGIVDASRKSLEVAEQAYKLSAIRFDNGLGTRLEMTDARNRVTLARLGLAQSLYNLNLSHARLERAVGK